MPANCSPAETTTRILQSGDDKMKRIKVLALTLALGLAGAAYAAQGGSQSAADGHAASCCAMKDCCAGGSCKMQGECCSCCEGGSCQSGGACCSARKK